MKQYLPSSCGERRSIHSTHRPCSVNLPLPRPQWYELESNWHNLRLTPRCVRSLGRKTPMLIFGIARNDRGHKRFATSSKSGATGEVLCARTTLQVARGPLRTPRSPEASGGAAPRPTAPRWREREGSARRQDDRWRCWPWGGADPLEALRVKRGNEKLDVKFWYARGDSAMRSFYGLYTKRCR